MRIESIREVAQGSAHLSNFLYGVQREYLAPPPPLRKEYTLREGSVRQDVVYQFRQIEGWLGDVPVSFTYLTAQRSYHTIKELFLQEEWRTALSANNRWLA